MHLRYFLSVRAGKYPLLPRRKRPIPASKTGGAQSCRRTKPRRRRSGRAARREARVAHRSDRMGVREYTITSRTSFPQPLTNRVFISNFWDFRFSHFPFYQEVLPKSFLKYSKLLSSIKINLFACIRILITFSTSNFFFSNVFASINGIKSASLSTVVKSQ